MKPPTSHQGTVPKPTEPRWFHVRYMDVTESSDWIKDEVDDLLSLLLLNLEWILCPAKMPETYLEENPENRQLPGELKLVRGNDSFADLSGDQTAGLK